MEFMIEIAYKKYFKESDIHKEDTVSKSSEHLSILTVYHASSAMFRGLYKSGSSHTTQTGSIITLQCRRPQAH